MDTTDDPHSDIVQAYLSGTATEEQMAQFEMRMREDPVFRDLFEAAEAKLHEELETLEPVAPPSGMIDEIVSQIDHGEISPAPVVKIDCIFACGCHRYRFSPCTNAGFGIL